MDASLPSANSPTGIAGPCAASRENKFELQSGRQIIPKTGGRRSASQTRTVGLSIDQLPFATSSPQRLSVSARRALSCSRAGAFVQCAEGKSGSTPVLDLGLIRADDYSNDNKNEAASYAEINHTSHGSNRLCQTTVRHGRASDRRTWRAFRIGCGGDGKVPRQEFLPPSLREFAHEDSPATNR